MQEVHGYPARARQFFIVLLPILITQISLMAPGFFNTVMAGHISKEDLAGIAVGANIFFPIFGAFMGLISGLTPVIAQYYGHGRCARFGASFSRASTGRRFLLCSCS